jgi:hypothetical protein
MTKESVTMNGPVGAVTLTGLSICINQTSFVGLSIPIRQRVKRRLGGMVSWFYGTS